jgi:hypothetical protein
MNRRLPALLPALLAAGSGMIGEIAQAMPAPVPPATERQLTRGPGGRILTNTGVWSPDGEWIVYDTRSDPAGEVFDGARLEMVNVRSGEVGVLFQAKPDAYCGVATFHPRAWKIVFILGPENPTPDWRYSACHRQGVIVEASPQASDPLPFCRLDARDLSPPFTPGALRGGSHVHVWDAAGEWVSFTYEDHVLSQLKEPGPDHDLNQRNLGVSVPGHAVHVPKTHPRNHDGEYFSVLVTRTTARPRPGSDEISRACEEAWIGTNGYLRTDGSRQRRALAFQGNVVPDTGQTIAEVFVADLPEDPTRPGDGPLAGTERRLPFPPRGVEQRRLTFTAARQFPGIQGPRHWLRSAPDGSRIAFLAKDDAGVVQLWTVSPAGGSPAQLTRNGAPVASAFTWSPDGRWLAHVMDNSVCLTEARTGETTRLTPRTDDDTAPRPEACVFSPDATRIAFVRRVPSAGVLANQVCCVELPPALQPASQTLK